LVKEMEAFKKARTLNQKAAEALDATCLALRETLKAIKPFTEVRMRWMIIILISATGINFVMFLTLLLVVFLKR